MSTEALQQMVMKRVNDWKTNKFDNKITMEEYGPVTRDMEWTCPPSFKLKSKNEINHDRRTNARKIISDLYKTITKDDILLGYQAADAIETKIFNESVDLTSYQGRLVNIGKTIEFLIPLSGFIDYQNPKVTPQQK